MSAIASRPAPAAPASARAPSPASPPARPDAAARAPAGASRSHEAAAFERALRRRAGEHPGDEAEEAQAAGDPASSAARCAAPGRADAAAFDACGDEAASARDARAAGDGTAGLAGGSGGGANAGTAPVADAPGARGTLPDAGVMQAAARSDLGGEAPASVAAALRGLPEAASWQLLLPTPGGVPLALQATRDAVPPGAAGAAPWSLSLACPPAERAAWARHAGRLDERLRARGLAAEHLRIEPDEQDRTD